MRDASYLPLFDKPPIIVGADVPPSETAKRDAAFAQVLEHAGPAWRERALAVMRSMPDSHVTGEDVRLACEAAGVRPHHHNAWGGLIQAARKAGLLVPTGTYRSMKAKGSHARKTEVYRRLRIP